MTHSDRWLAVIAAITPQAPEDLDPLIGGHIAGAPEAGHLLFPAEAADTAPPFSFEAESTVTFAARITEATPNRLELAMNLAQMALEKGAEAIILSHVDDPMLDRFGFRVERIAGETEEERAACEAQVIHFWNIVFVI